MKFIPSDEYPRAFQVTGAAAPITCQVTYVGQGNAHTGHAMDGQVLPLILAAPELLTALRGMISAYAWNADWSKPETLHSAVRLAGEAIAKASPKP